MKTILKQLSFVAVLSAVVSVLFLFGCEKEPQEDFLGSLSVQLTLKEGLGDLPLDNINLSLINTQDNVERKMLTNVQGSALFTSMPAGTYNLNVSEPREDGEYTLTGSLNSVVINMGEDTYASLELDAQVLNAGLVIKEIYYVGANDKYVSMFKDQFIEIFNNSSETIYADGLHVGHLYPDKWDRTLPSPPSEMLDIENYAFLEWIYKIPGNGTQYPIEPSKSIVIAFNAINFKEGNPEAANAVDNTIADFEIYAIPWLEAQGRQGNPYFDFDNPDVPNVTPLYLVTPSDFFLIDQYNPALIIFRKENDFNEGDIYTFSFVNNSGKQEEHRLMKLPIESVIDGVEIMINSTRGGMKKLPASIDASFTYIRANGGAVYSGLSSRRKIDETATTKFGRIILQDLNNSFLDFETIDHPDAKGYNNL